MTMDYSPWSEREIWPFLKKAISPKSEWPRPPKLVCMHVTSFPTCMFFLSRFRSIEFFDDHGFHGQKGKFGCLQFGLRISYNVVTQLDGLAYECIYKCTN